MEQLTIEKIERALKDLDHKRGEYSGLTALKRITTRKMLQDQLKAIRLTEAQRQRDEFIKRQGTRQIRSYG